MLFPYNVKLAQYSIPKMNWCHSCLNFTHLKTKNCYLCFTLIIFSKTNRSCCTDPQQTIINARGKIMTGNIALYTLLLTIHHIYVHNDRCIMIPQYCRSVHWYVVGDIAIAVHWYVAGDILHILVIVVHFMSPKTCRILLSICTCMSPKTNRILSICMSPRTYRIFVHIMSPGTYKWTIILWNNLLSRGQSS